jgi:hypothetical protein
VAGRAAYAIVPMSPAPAPSANGRRLRAGRAAYETSHLAADADAGAPVAGAVAIGPRQGPDPRAAIVSTSVRAAVADAPMDANRAARPDAARPIGPGGASGGVGFGNLNREQAQNQQTGKQLSSSSPCSLGSTSFTDGSSTGSCDPGPKTCPERPIASEKARMTMDERAGLTASEIEAQLLAELQKLPSLRDTQSVRIRPYSGPKGWTWELDSIEPEVGPTQIKFIDIATVVARLQQQYHLDLSPPPPA